jgi:hypothetical protein
MSKEGIKRYLAEQFRQLLENDEFLDALPGHLSPGGSDAADCRHPIVRFPCTSANQQIKKPRANFPGLLSLLVTKIPIHLIVFFTHILPGIKWVI